MAANSNFFHKHVYLGISLGPSKSAKTSANSSQVAVTVVVGRIIRGENIFGEIRLTAGVGELGRTPR
jgi:hypothetical protein